MTEICFHRFHVCTVGINQQTNIEMHSPSIHHTFSLPSLLLIQLFLSQTLSLSLSLWFCVVLHPLNPFNEVFRTLWCCWCNRKSFNTGLFLQLRLKSAISKYFSHQLLQYFIQRVFSICLSWCCCRSRSFILYLRFVTLVLHFWHAVFKHL